MVAHPTLLRGAAATSRAAGPVILKRVDDDVVGALLDELADGNGVATAMATRSLPAEGSGALTLFQPVHRVFQVALLEVVCDRVGYPRLDPRKIDSAGMVLRRRVTDAAGQVTPDLVEGWMQDAPTPSSRVNGAPKRRQLRGWIPFSGSTADARPTLDLNLDPDPGRRVGSLGTGRPELDLRVLLTRANGGALRERIIPLFPAPPAIGAATGKTLLYALVPLAGGEQSEVPETPAPFDRDQLSAHLPQLLRGGLAASIPKAGDYLAWSETKAAAVTDDIALFVTQLRQIALEMDAFGTSAEARALFAALDAIDLVFFDDARWPTTADAFAALATLEALNEIGGGHAVLDGLVHRSAATFLRTATTVLLEGDDQTASVRMPLSWPVVSRPQATAILTAAQESMRARITSLVPRAPQFGDPTREYRLRAFVRVRDDDGSCPPSLVWSDYSDPFTIAPWYAASDAPPAVIPLPDAMDRAALKALKPNIAFAVPKKLADFLNGNDAKKLVSGDGGPGASGIDLAWICSFSIPIITLCAFIVLNIFLQLFDLIFRWLLFIKICIPIPVPKKAP